MVWFNDNLPSFAPAPTLDDESAILEIEAKGVR
jgi:hypothetical protein